MENSNSFQIKSGIYDKGQINFEDTISSLKSHHNIKEVGSIHTFSGIVRGTSKEGKPVKGMKIDAYDELANKAILRICEEIKKKHGIIDIVLIHYKGDFEISDELVHVIIASSHRENGFAALRDAVEMYKKEIAVWKKEKLSNGDSFWVH